MRSNRNHNWARADILACVAIICGLGGCIVGYWVQIGTPEIRCWLDLPSESCQKIEPIPKPKPGLLPKIDIKVGGSTSMARMTRYLSERASSYSPNISISYFQKGSDEGMKELRNGTIDVAALSRELSDSEKQDGFTLVRIADDPIVLIVGKDNPINELSYDQVQKIFRCKITDWSQVGGKPGAIKVINRGHVSGTRHTFQKQALNGKEFCGDIKTWKVDETIPILRKLGSNGITFATYSDVVRQSTGKVVKINGLMPNASNYPYHHSLYYVYKSDNPKGAEFLKYIKSSEGSKAIEGWVKIRYGGLTD